MSVFSTIKQLGTRHLSCTVELVQWSNKMDLMAYSTEKGEVIIQRLNWQKIITYPPPIEDIKVRSLCWQHTESIIAVGYSNGQVCLLDIENEISTCTLNYNEDIEKVYFSQKFNAPDYRTPYPNQTELTSDFYLPNLPSLNTLGAASVPQVRKMVAKGCSSFLVVILKNGRIHLLLRGVLHAGTINMREHVENPNNFLVSDIYFSADFLAMYAIVRDGKQLKIIHINNATLNECISPMMHLANYYCNIVETKTYINDIIQCIAEAWEAVLIEMDNKLTKYTNSQAAPSLSADFLELLVFGYATNEIEEFLMHELTEKEAKKLENSVDLSYSTIQNLVSKPLHMAVINMFYFLNTIKGFARTPQFEPLLNIEQAEESLRECGAFVMKVLELQQVVDQSVNDMKLFFTWLIVVIMRLNQQDINEDVSQLTTEQFTYLAEYLYNFEDFIENDDGTRTRKKFNLGKVGQYLEDKPLQQMVKKNANNLWYKLLDENHCLRNSKLLFSHDKQLSLIQQRNKTFKTFEEMFGKPNYNTSSAFMLNTPLVCCVFDDNFDYANPNSENHIKCSFTINEMEKSDLMAVLISWKSCLLLEFSHKFTQLSSIIVHLTVPLTKVMPSLYHSLQFNSIQFYNENYISVLVTSKSEDTIETATEANQHVDEQQQQQSFLVQMPLEKLKDHINIHLLPKELNLTENSSSESIFNIVNLQQFHKLDSICTHFAVSGTRKVATMLSDKQRKMMIYEMEPDEDENSEDAETSQNSTLDNTMT